MISPMAVVGSTGEMRIFPMKVPSPDHKHFGLGLDRRGGHRGSARQSCVGLIDRQHPKNGGEQQQ
jgi:hypothetical protein